MSEELPVVGFLENLEDEVRTQLVSQGTLYSLASGQHIIEEGAEQDHLFLILEGIFDVFTKQKGNRTAVATITAGGTIGEINIFNPSTASAEVISRGEGKVWAIDRFGLNAFVEGNPQASGWSWLPSHPLGPADCVPGTGSFGGTFRRSQGCRDPARDQLKRSLEFTNRTVRNG
ncbi:cyclic nucleotide-binding domain-containing protein [Akkermansiaceae bacterium]|nr:cyclic nucleotide-binding domain-containing protein [Akkermansiaceae bacterium]